MPLPEARLPTVTATRRDPSMLRTLLMFALLLLVGLAHAAGDPERHGADGGGACPVDADAPVQAENAGPPAATEAAKRSGGAVDRPQATGGSGAESTRARLRWHSFVPGMFR
jgi:hypothetical protein